MNRQYSYEEVLAATKEQNGGRYRLICNRTIEGERCVCYANEVVLGNNRYWNIRYKVNGKELTEFNHLVNEMYEIACAKCVELYSKGVLVILWRY